jgi:hypothetical protein
LKATVAPAATRSLNTSGISNRSASTTWPRKAVATVIERRFALPTVSLAETAVASSGGWLLAPGWPRSAVQHEPTLPW